MVHQTDGSMNPAVGRMSHWMGGYMWGWLVLAVIGVALLVFVMLKISEK